MHLPTYMAHFLEDIASLLDPSETADAGAEDIAAGIEDIEPDALPEPSRSLLVHERDMTGTLAAFWGSPIELRPLRVHREGEVLYRQVVLIATNKRIPVEAGAIRIHLDRFPPEALGEITGNRRPLGAILAEYRIPYTCSPRGFFRIPTNRFLREAFGDVRDTMHYGRRNRLVNPAGELLAEVVEILPMIEEPSAEVDQ